MKTVHLNVFLSALFLCSALVYAQNTLADESVSTPANETNHLQALNPSEVERLIRQNGIENVVNDLWDDEMSWGMIMEEIKNGNEQWIALVPQLIKGTDANSAESLGVMLAAALAKNPLAVVKVLDNEYRAINSERICGMFYVERRDDVIDRYYRNTRQILAQSGDEVGQCLQILDGAMTYIEEQRESS